MTGHLITSIVGILFADVKEKVINIKIKKQSTGVFVLRLLFDLYVRTDQLLQKLVKITYGS